MASATPAGPDEDKLTMWSHHPQRILYSGSTRLLLCFFYPLAYEQTCTMCDIVPQLDFGSAEHLKDQQCLSNVTPMFATKSYGIISSMKVNIFCLQISNIVMCTVFVWIVSVAGLREMIKVLHESTADEL